MQSTQQFNKLLVTETSLLCDLVQVSIDTKLSQFYQLIFSTQPSSSNIYLLNKQIKSYYDTVHIMALPKFENYLYITCIFSQASHEVIPKF